MPIWRCMAVKRCSRERGIGGWLAQSRIVQPGAYCLDRLKESRNWTQDKCRSLLCCR